MPHHCNNLMQYLPDLRAELMQDLPNLSYDRLMPLQMRARLDWTVMARISGKMQMLLLLFQEPPVAAAGATQ